MVLESFDWIKICLIWTILPDMTNFVEWKVFLVEGIKGKEILGDVQKIDIFIDFGGF